jgi:hypothetical protein
MTFVASGGEENTLRPLGPWLASDFAVLGGEEGFSGASGYRESTGADRELVCWCWIEHNYGFYMLEFGKFAENRQGASLTRQSVALN